MAAEEAAQEVAAVDSVATEEAEASAAVEAEAVTVEAAEADVDSEEEEEDPHSEPPEAGQNSREPGRCCEQDDLSHIGKVFI